MPELDDNLQVFLNEVAASAEANLGTTQYEKINWAGLLAFIQQLWSIFGPIILPLIAPTPPATPKP